MVKFSGYSLITSFNPFHSIILKQHHRLSLNLFHKNSTKSRRFSACAQKGQLHEMGVERYRPPLFSVAPMMEWTDNHYRTLARIVTKHAWLYTEMLAAETIVYQQENLDRFLACSPQQNPVVLQIGGNNLENLAKATELASAYGYDEINFNCGCPSPKVAGHGCFGVRLMLDPKFVGEAMSVIAANTDVPVSVKCRIGVDDHDSYNELCDFIYKVSSLSPTKHFIIHSRKALLNGISPADNRKIPPLKYEYYYALLRDFPDLRFTINGGIECVDEANLALKEGAHGVMLGRAAYQKLTAVVLEKASDNNSQGSSNWSSSFGNLNFEKASEESFMRQQQSGKLFEHVPWRVLGHVDSAIYGDPRSGLTRRQVLEEYQVYGDAIVGSYGNNRPNIRDVVKPLFGFFHAEPGNGLWKRKADAALLKCKTLKSFFEETLVAFPDHVLDTPIVEEYPGRQDLFANVRGLLPPPYKTREEEIVVAYA